MRSYQSSARVTMLACRVVAGIVLALLPVFWWLLQLYTRYVIQLPQRVVLSLDVGFYLCAPGALLALMNMDRLLKNILEGQLFVMDNVRRIRAVRWCCLEVSLVCVAAAVGFYALIFIGLIMAFLCLTVTVVGQVMKAGVEIREENDLTV